MPSSYTVGIAALCIGYFKFVKRKFFDLQGCTYIFIIIMKLFTFLMEQLLYGKPQINQNDNAEEDELGRACSMHGAEGKCIQRFGGKAKRK
jgi:hypothetical protein